MRKQNKQVAKYTTQCVDNIKDLYALGRVEQSYLESKPGSIVFGLEAFVTTNGKLIDPVKVIPEMIYLPGIRSYALIADYSDQYSDVDVANLYMKIWSSNL